MLKIKQNTTGFTLIEFLIVFGLMATVFAVTIGFFSNFKNKEALDKNISLVSEVLRQAKHFTINSKDSNQFGVHFNSNNIVLFIGPTYSAISPTNQVYELSPSVELYSINISNGGSDIIFKRLTGDAEYSGTVTFKSLIASTTRTITIHKTGLIE